MGMGDDFDVSPLTAEGQGRVLSLCCPILGSQPVTI